MHRNQYLTTSRGVCSDRKLMTWGHVRLGNRGEDTVVFVGDRNVLSIALQLAYCWAFSPKTGFRLTFAHQGWPHTLCVVGTPDRAQYPIRKFLALHGQVRLDCSILQRILAEKYKSLRTTKFEA